MIEKKQLTWPAPFFDRFNTKKNNQDKEKTINIGGMRYNYNQYIESIRSELESLFNASNTPKINQHNLDEDIYNKIRYTSPFYGVEKISSLFEEGELYKHIIETSFEEAIKAFEPRVTNPTVQIIKIDDNINKIFFNISGNIILENNNTDHISLDMAINIKNDKTNY